jgi:5-methylcytosine-specific restriction endonuclease McrA
LRQANLAALREQRRAKREAERVARLAPRPCRGCGIVFVPARSSGVFHDADCRERTKRRSEDVMEHRRRAKLIARRFRATIYGRDESRCYLCGQMIDQAVRFPDPRSPTIDHVMPYSAGGSDEPANLRAAHLGCNMDKGDRLPYWWERSISAQPCPKWLAR